MSNVAHAKKSPVSETNGCACGWGRHCRCLAGRERFWESTLVEQMREFLASGPDLVGRRRTLDAFRETVAAHDQGKRDQEALIALYDVLPRQKDIDLVQRLTCDDYRAPETDEEIAARLRTPVEHVRDLRARIVAAYEGRPLPVPRAWRVAAAGRRRRVRAQRAARLSRRAKAVA